MNGNGFFETGQNQLFVFAVDGDCILGVGSLLKILDSTSVVSQSSGRGLVELCLLKLVGVWKLVRALYGFRCWGVLLSQLIRLEKVFPFLYNRRLFFANLQLSIFIELQRDVGCFYLSCPPPILV